MKKQKLTIAIPVYNEAEALADFHQRISSVIERIVDEFPLEIDLIYVNDGSRDATYSVMERLEAGRFKLQLINFSRNFGKEAALSAALDHCHDSAIVFLDGDGQHPPEMLPDFIKHWLYDEADVIFAVQAKRQDGFIKQRFVGAFYRLINAGSRFEIPKNAADYKLLSPRAMQALKDCPEKVRFFKGLSSWIGFKQVSIPYTPEARIAGSTKWSFLKLIALSSEGVISFSVVPLRATMLLGFFIALSASIYGFWIIFQFFFLGYSLPGYSSLITATVFLGGVELVMLGILGEYIGHILREVKSRPVYIVAEKSEKPRIDSDEATRQEQYAVYRG
ncbi:glycosyltransferase family 2 protein [Polycladidibacter stylochi]|uniref:glycosyltransferase family 2 protein n=1 Tax=Polycladidibacter stylochi TaxID=1807766 RepID=UPI0009EC2BD3|nr:glycosyltransferase family 2 protein [Pseudovibrio stylochi]